MKCEAISECPSCGCKPGEHHYDYCSHEVHNILCTNYFCECGDIFCDAQSDQCPFCKRYFPACELTLDDYWKDFRRFSICFKCYQKRVGNKTKG